MSFVSAIFGGPSDAEKSAAATEGALGAEQSTAFQQQLSSAMGEQSAIARQLTPLANAGPSANGWSPAEAAAVSSQNINAAAAASRNARQSVGAQLAGAGGGG